jgi:cell division topological specificity factor
MNIFNFLRNAPKRTTASVAKERLQIIVSHESARNNGQDFIRKLQQELLEVISRYVEVDREEIKVQMERNRDQDVLELSVTLPDAATLSQRERKDFTSTAISSTASNTKANNNSSVSKASKDTTESQAS